MDISELHKKSENEIKGILNNAQVKLNIFDLALALSREVAHRNRVNIVKLLDGAIATKEVAAFRNWNVFEHIKPKPEDFEVLAYHHNWIDPDDNQKGTRVGFMMDDGTFVSAKWCSYHDAYESDNETLPLFWKELG